MSLKRILYIMSRVHSTETFSLALNGGYDPIQFIIKCCDYDLDKEEGGMYRIPLCHCFW